MVATNQTAANQTATEEESLEMRRLTREQWLEHFQYTQVEHGEERLPLFQVALNRHHFRGYEPDQTEWLNVYSEWQDMMSRGPGVYSFPDYPWCYEVTILADWYIWGPGQEPFGPGWEAFEGEELIVGWQRNLTKSPDQWRPIRRIDYPVANYYKRNLKYADYDAFFAGPPVPLKGKGRGKGKGKGKGKAK
jgi:hypothetical protein